MLKEWKRQHTSHYELYDNGVQTCSLTLNSHSAFLAHIQCEHERLSIERKGFWLNQFEITDANNRIKLQIAPKKWYSNAFIVTFENAVYTLSFRNNPLCELVIQHNQREILAYGLESQNGKVKVRITQGIETIPPILDCIMWYLFLPIAEEHIVEELEFTTWSH